MRKTANIGERWIYSDSCGWYVFEIISQKGDLEKLQYNCEYLASCGRYRSVKSFGAEVMEDGKTWTYKNLKNQEKIK